MKTLAIDIETYSSVSLQKAGVYAYAASPDFEILLFGYAWDDGPVEVIDMAQGQKLRRLVCSCPFCRIPQACSSPLPSCSKEGGAVSGRCQLRVV